MDDDDTTFNADYFAGYEDEVQEEEDDEFEDVPAQRISLNTSSTPLESELSVHHDDDDEEFEDVPFPEPLDMPQEPVRTELDSLQAQPTLDTMPKIEAVSFTIAKPM
ncbi:hypothetical protein M427DRAFT_369759 [Gonapodya prolifera JEL478]|uniref:Uncharacterized protein n=1 Tax=Gonapodya prolifera (strain JEL478) TaxID=1344416 RepID=A0A139A9U0_GONPJ|nr:hypothetical protein M427DRAFT_369759 [Gonapodya prolifera JEL478]|eukprot:KXS13546.1 hypothetical protein M427DRAFT_369759 [Gonapodya prolifera JEL478]